MANQVVQVVLRCETASETEHLGNKSVPNIKSTFKTQNALPYTSHVANQMTDD